MLLRSGALIIGVDKFDDPNVGTLKYTVNDADALYQTLTSIPNGFPRENVMLITPPNLTPTIDPHVTTL